MQGKGKQEQLFFSGVKRLFGPSFSPSACSPDPSPPPTGILVISHNFLVNKITVTSELSSTFERTWSYLLTFPESKLKERGIKGLTQGHTANRGNGGVQTQTVWLQHFCFNLHALWCIDLVRKLH